MAFIKYEIARPAAAEVRIGKLGITLTNVGLSKHSLGDATYVNLHWDADTSSIGITPSDASDKSAFAIKPRGKNGSDKFIAAGKFYEHFGLTNDALKLADAKLVDHDGIAAFALAGGKTTPESEPVEKKPYTGKPRGRRKKSDEGTEAASGE